MIVIFVTKRPRTDGRPGFISLPIDFPLASIEALSAALKMGRVDGQVLRYERTGRDKAVITGRKPIAVSKEDCNAIETPAFEFVEEARA